MQEVHELDDPENITDYSELSNDEIRNKLIWHWFNIFRQNPDFEEYCEARRRGDTVTCRVFEQKFSRIADLYTDWGDIHDLPSMHDDKSEIWKNWLDEKHNLFPPTAIELIKVPVDNVGNRNFLAAIPSGYSKKQLCELFEQFLDTHPEVLGQLPKYDFNIPKNKSWLETLQRLEKADVVYDLFSDSDLKLSHAKIVQQIYITPLLQKLGFRWSTPSGAESNERTVINLGKFYRASIDATIHGIFPAKGKT